MPQLRIQTNQQLTGEQRAQLLEQASRTVAEALGKPERYVMVAVEDGAAMIFAGSTEPLAYLELKSIGLDGSRTPELSARLCALMADHLGIAADRVYIEFTDAPRHLWGWNGGTF